MAQVSRAMALQLDRRSTVPVYLQLKHHIVHLISAGEWQPGSMLPSVRQLATDLGLGTSTVQRAYGELQDQGMLVSQAGRGIFVADLAGAPREHTLGPERANVLRGSLARAVAHARSLGFGADDILQTVRDLLEGRSDEGAVPRVLFVGASDDFATKYRALLAEALAGLPYTVEAITVGDLEAGGDALLDRLEPIACAVSLVRSVPDVRRLMGHRQARLFPLVVDLTAETQHALVHLPDVRPIGLLVEEAYLTSARALVRQFHGVDEDLLVVGDRSPAALRRLVAECSIIIHSFNTRKLLEGRVPATTQLVELRYRPNAASVTRLRALLASDADATPWSNGRSGEPALASSRR